MGCCSSQPEEEEGEGIAVRNMQIIAQGGNLPLSLRQLKWTAPAPVTTGQLQSQRDAFWDTAPSYEGRSEIWQALRAACEAQDTKLAQSILDASGITIPTGNLTEGCYDERGNRYVIPIYCLVPPTNLIQDEGPAQREDEDGAKDTSQMNLIVPSASNDTIITEMSRPALASIATSPLSTANSEFTFPILIRLSTGVDLPFTLPSSPSSPQTIAQLRKRLFSVSDLSTRTSLPTLSPKTHTIRFIYLGRLLEDKFKLIPITETKEEGYEGGVEKGHVRIPKRGVIQALIHSK
ncbi:hypothetical protein BZG36_04485 [Bifiguratus adelaidae]|uniref:DC-UbP/UBTD2 N-terminal domain-containing protein n=1 Tax=Bifiguratus adelaidae TaxID=1938954 RepID=A0A261XYE0_9FUNG|nr:hypothetical protein BZG36_04485 [Bifiguratus adelaidae]